MKDIRGLLDAVWLAGHLTKSKDPPTDWTSIISNIAALGYLSPAEVEQKIEERVTKMRAECNICPDRTHHVKAVQQARASGFDEGLEKGKALSNQRVAIQARAEALREVGGWLQRSVIVPRDDSLTRFEPFAQIMQTEIKVLKSGQMPSPEKEK